MERVTLTDERVIAAQIGRPPRGLSGIPRRCSYGFAVVARVHPIVEGKPFPTLYWLTCPHLARRVDRLESEGWIGRLEACFAVDPELAKELAAAREEYVRARLALLSDVEAAYLEARGMLPALGERGIGGIAEPNRIKCLHLHVAHALASTNPIGRIVLETIKPIECLPEEVICSAFPGAEQIERINR